MLSSTRRVVHTLSRAEFIRRVALDAAETVILDETVIDLSSDVHDSFMQMIFRP